MAQRIMKKNSYLARQKLVSHDYPTTSPDKGITNRRST